MSLRVFAALLVFAAVMGNFSFFVVREWQNALVFQLGKIVRVETLPGLKGKMPLLENVRLFDVRARTFEPELAERFITNEKKNLMVDLSIKWRIRDVKRFYVSVGGNDDRAVVRLTQAVNDGLRAEIGKRDVHDVVSGERQEIMETIRRRADMDGEQYGVSVVDVRLRRVDFPEEVSERVYRRIEAERKRVANELRSQGYAAAERIRAEADKEREIVLAEATRQSQEIKAQGDAEAATLYARAIEADAGFYDFYRALQAYRNTFADGKTPFYLGPEGKFFSHFEMGKKP